MKRMIAAAVLTLGIGAFAIPATAADYYGGDVWTQNDPTRFAPDGGNAGGDVMGYIDDESVASGTAAAAPASPAMVFETKDEAHAQW